MAARHGACLVLRIRWLTSIRCLAACCCMYSRPYINFNIFIKSRRCMLAQEDKRTYLNRHYALGDQLQQFCSCSWTPNRNQSVSSDDNQSLSQCIYANRGFLYPGMHLQVSSRAGRTYLSRALAVAVCVVRAARLRPAQHRRKLRSHAAVGRRSICGR
jgi:hypothetical protein